MKQSGLFGLSGLAAKDEAMRTTLNPTKPGDRYNVHTKPATDSATKLMIVKSRIPSNHKAGRTRQVRTLGPLHN